MVQPTLSSTLGLAETGSTKMETVPFPVNIHPMPHPLTTQSSTYNSARKEMGSSGLFSMTRVIASLMSLVTPVRAIKK